MNGHLSKPSCRDCSFGSDENCWLWSTSLNGYRLFRGKDSIGFQEAARDLFNKEIAQLTDDEYLASVAMIVAPNQFHVIDQPGRNQERSQRIKRLLSRECQPMGLADVYYRECGSS